MDIFILFSKASFLVKLILLILVSCSILSWTIIIYRSYVLWKAFSAIKIFENKFFSGIKLSCLYQKFLKHCNNLSGFELIFYSGFKEFTNLYYNKNCILKSAIEGSARVMHIYMNRELEALETYIPFLGTIGSISPYIGLFGTVWGVIHSLMGFSFIAEETSNKQITLQMIAPGIAEALIATAISLFVAIPAIIGFNRLSLLLNKLEHNYNIFIEEIVVILYGQNFFDSQNN